MVTTHYDARTRPINYGCVGLDALKTPCVAHVTIALEFYTHYRTSFRILDFRSLYVARVFRIWGDLEMGHGRFQDPETVMVGPFQDPENAQGHGMHLPPKAVKP